MKRFLYAVLPLMSLLNVDSARAGGTPTPPPSELLHQSGSGGLVSNGDYVSVAVAPALDSPYHYFIEVPPGTPALNVQFFDADIGAGGGGAAFDLNVGGGGFATSVAYSVIDPTGTLVAGPAVLGPGVCGACNNAWVQFPTFASPIAGHWEVRVDMSSAITAGNDINSYGLRAHDGNAAAGGTELNVYAESFLPLGTLGNPSSATTNLYPYISSGCEFDANDFDGDAPQAGSSLNYNSRTGAFSQATGISGPTVWLNSTISGWTTDNNAVDYGIWHSPQTITAVAGGLTANALTFWYGAFNAANPPTGGLGPPPSAQPENGSLRIYLPRDGGGAPTKPYLEQLLTHASGPNPPVPGMVSQVRVTVRLVNPTPHAIAFAAPTRVVSTEVPGAGAVYAGSPLLSQGSLTAQPALGATGSVVWDPGNLAAGATATLAYLVDVTPPAPGSRVVVTGTPASLGTSAVFLDETARLAQARANFTFGPLCELAVTAGLSTHATISSFKAYADDGGAVLEWHTSSEIATEGFDVYHHNSQSGEIRAVNSRRQLGLLTSPQGGRYRLLDPKARSGETALYTIVETERGGTQHLHGPFQVVIEDSAPQASSLVADSLDAQAKVSDEVRSSRTTRQLSDLTASTRLSSTFPAERSSRVKLLVPEQGLTLVSDQSLADAFQRDLSVIRRALDRRAFSLQNRAASVAWTPHPEGLLFYATETDSLYTRDNVYMLEIGASGAIFESRKEPSFAPSLNPLSFPSRRSFELDVFAATAFGPDPQSDYWFWKTVVAGHPQLGRQTFDLEAPGLTDGSTASVTVRLQSATDSGIVDEHQARILIDGVELGTTMWSGIDDHSASFGIPANLLLETGSSLEIEGVLADGVAFSGFFVDGFDVVYPRRFELHQGTLEISETAGALAVGALGDSPLFALDISDPKRPAFLEGVDFVITPEGIEAHFVADPAARYLVASADTLKSPSAVRPVAPSTLASQQHRAGYLILGHGSLLAAAEGLAQRDFARKLLSESVDVERIYDEFADGFPEPAAIRDFLRSATKNWQQPPRFVALVGAGSLDYRDLLGFGTGLLPPMTVLTNQGLFATDQPYADFDDDGTPNLALGRIPARNAQELEAFVAKLIAFESSPPGDWQHRWLTLADRADGGVSFAADSDLLTEGLPDTFDIGRVHMEAEPLASLQDQLLRAWDRGAGIVHFFGHGGLDRFSAEGLLTSANASELAQSPRLPLVLAPTCAVNRFALPGFLSLGETLVLDPDGGAAAVFSATGLSQHPEARILSSHLRDALLAPTRRPLGQQIQSAIKSYLDAGGNSDLLRVYSLLGDPLTRRPLRPRRVPTPPAASGTS